MAGHSKWENIKRKKAKVDALRGKVFARLSKDIIVAAKMCPNPNDNPRLRLAIDIAKSHNMPMVNIDKAISKSKSSSEDTSLVEFELYGKGGLAIIMFGETDNKAALISDINTCLKKYGISFLPQGSLKFIFDIVHIVHTEIDFDEDKALELSIDIGADDFRDSSGLIEFITDETNVNSVMHKLDNMKILSSSSKTAIPKVMLSKDISEEDEKDNNILIERLQNIEGIDIVISNK